MSNIEQLPLPKKPQKKIEKTKRPGIYRVTYPSGKVSWKAYAFAKGKKPVSETFDKEADAINFKQKNEVHAKEKRAFLTNKLFDKIKVRELAECYLNGGELNGRQIQGGVGVKGKPLGHTAIGYVTNFIDWLKANGDPSITDFDDDAAMDYIELHQRKWWQNNGWRYGRTVLNSSIQREISAIRPIWTWAKGPKVRLK